MCSDQADSVEDFLNRYVSIPRSGFCVFRPVHGRGHRAGVGSVSIPRSGFCVFRPFKVTLHEDKLDRFNPSVGILCVQTPIHPPPPGNKKGSTAKVAILLSPDQRVAYPGCSLAIEAHRQVCYACVCDQIADCGPRRAKWQIASFALLPKKVSIPRSGFCVFRPGRC